MIVTDQIDEVRKHRWADPNLTWGFVPTMGYLHAGHLSLVQLSLAGNERTAVSIYVNPTQFAPTEDLSSYPRNLAGDLALLEAAGVDLVFTPSDAIMYPPGFQTTVSLSQVTQPLEGSSRPTHFAGVATVVAKLFNIVQPTRAYFGQKDAQQTIVLRQMVRDLNFNLEMIVGPTGREADGLAMSSRNKYLSEAHRAAAPVLYRALRAAQTAVANGERSGEVLRNLMREMITAVPQAKIDYVSAADPKTLEELAIVENGVLLSTAVFFGKTRLIDNILIYATENTA
ncbi:MAG: pantoate--beta-alanine ligase [Chloroflexota bacterium]